MARLEPGFTVWFTGLPDAGKTTLAQLLQERLSQRGYLTVILDAGETQARLAPDLGFSQEDRFGIIRRFSYVAWLFNQSGGVVLVPFISPDPPARQAAREEIGRFFEVYVDCPIEVCMGRDVKGRYASARERETLPQGAAAFEPPLAPEMTVHTDRETPEQCVAVILERLETLGYVRS